MHYFACALFFAYRFPRDIALDKILEEDERAVSDAKRDEQPL